VRFDGTNSRVGIGRTDPGYRLDVTSEATNTAAINMSTWTRCAKSLSFVSRGSTFGGNANGGGVTASFCHVLNTPSVALDSELGTITNDNTWGSYFVCKKSGIWSLTMTAGTATERGSVAIDVSSGTNGFQDNMNPNSDSSWRRALAFTTAGYFMPSTLSYTGYLPSNDNYFYKFKCNSMGPGQTSYLNVQITFICEQPTAAGTWPL
jgi:hypothetical protein